MRCTCGIVCVAVSGVVYVWYSVCVVVNSVAYVPYSVFIVVAGGLVVCVCGSEWCGIEYSSVCVVASGVVYECLW